MKKVLADLKPVYTAASEPLALVALDTFESCWGGKYPLIVTSWRNNWSELSTFFKYPPEIRKIIYTTNMIESYHRQLRKVTKGKSISPMTNHYRKCSILPRWMYFENGRDGFKTGDKSCCSYQCFFRIR